MFQYSNIQAALLGKVGFRQNIDPTGWQLPTALISGDHFVNDQHAMLTFENLKSVAPDFDSIVAIADKGGALGSWLEQKMFSSLKKMLNEWRGLKLSHLSARTLIERERLFRPEIGDGTLSEETNNFVGLELVSTDSMSIAHQIERFALQLEENQTVMVYVFRDGEKHPIYKKEAVYNQKGGAQWFKVDWILSDGGKYFIGYKESDLQGRAINGVGFRDQMVNGQYWSFGNHHFAVAGFDVDYASYNTGIGVMQVENSFVIGDNDAGITWMCDSVGYTWDDNYGLNLEITSFCDYSSLVIGQGDAFAYVWALRTAIDLMRELIYNPNSNINRNQSNAKASKEMLIYEIDGEAGKPPTGLLKDYRNALKGIMFDDAGVDKVCLPCKRKGVKFKVKG